MASILTRYLPAFLLFTVAVFAASWVMDDPGVSAEDQDSIRAQIHHDLTEVLVGFALAGLVGWWVLHWSPLALVMGAGLHLAIWGALNTLALWFGTA